jgi:hypothetical protein
METTQGLSLYSYLYLKLTKLHVFLTTFSVFYGFSSIKLEGKKGRTGSAWRWGESKMILVTVPGIGGEGMKESSGGG